jgi:hypothetical protein
MYYHRGLPLYNIHIELIKNKVVKSQVRGNTFTKIDIKNNKKTRNKWSSPRADLTPNYHTKIIIQTIQIQI